jgi:hypothetical protein
MLRIPKCAVGILALLFGQALISKADVSHPSSGTWASTRGSMTDTRTGASAALLPDGRVLIAGGTGAGGPLDTAELYDSGGFFTATTPMHVARAGHACVALQDGRVLVAGGASTQGDATKTAEIYDPVTADWSVVGEMAQARLGATATLLKDGRVLVAGGHATLGVSPTLEIFDSATNAFTAAGELSSPRKGPCRRAAAGRSSPDRRRYHWGRRPHVHRRLRPVDGLGDAGSGALHGAGRPLGDNAG